MMLLRHLGGLGTVLLVVLALVAHQLGWADGRALGAAAAVLALVVALVGVVQLPWDLVFAASDVLARQSQARTQGLAPDDAEVAFALASRRRALVLALTLHALGAGLALAARGLVGDTLGLVMAVAFLASMGVRPIHAFYEHTRARLGRAAHDAMLPRQSALELDLALTALTQRLDDTSRAEETERGALTARIDLLDARAREDAAAWRKSAAVTDDKLERVLRELERTVEKTQQSAEVLAGIRAFVRLVRES